MGASSGRAVTVAPKGENHCLLGKDSVSLWYRELLDNAILHRDSHQQQAVDLLQKFSNEIASPQPEGGFLSRLVGARKRSAEEKQGVYIYGSVGRGKTFLMDGLFLNLPVANKMRAHFHGFMRHFHADMKASESESDPLATVAARLAQRYQVICFDEFHVSDIADAMILARMLELLLDAGVSIVATSNYAPDGLYPNGLARDRFVPAIELIKQRMYLHNLDGDTDYRLRTLTTSERYLFPDNKENLEHFSQLFSDLALDIRLTPNVKLGSRRIPAVKRSSTTVWFEYSELCAGNWSQADYLMLAERFNAVFVSGVPQIDSKTDSESARRFTWLIDVLYDAKIKLALCGAVSLDELFLDEGGESGRTISRLREMQSLAYLKSQVRQP